MKGDTAWLLIALRRLDSRLASAAAMVPAVYGLEPSNRGFRGLYVGASDVVAALHREPGAPAFADASDGTSGDGTEASGRLALLARTCALTPFDLDLMVIALAPDIDLRYERIYAYLQDDVTRRRPTLDLALNLLCASPAEKLSQQSRLAATAPLVAEDLIRLVPDPAHADPPRLAHYLRVDEQIVGYLVGRDGLDRRVAAFAAWVDPAGSNEAAAAGDITPSSIALDRIGAGAAPLTLYFERRDRAAGLAAATAIARRVGSRLLHADLSGALTAPGEWGSVLRVLTREASFHGAVLYLDAVDAVRDQPRECAGLAAALARHPGITILGGETPWAPETQIALPVVTVRLAPPSFEIRRACWRSNLDAVGMRASDVVVDRLAECFRLSESQIRNAVRSVRDADRLAGGNGDARDRLFAAARAQSGQALSALTQRIEPRATWADLILPDDVVVQLRELAARHTERSRVLGEWGFDRKLSRGKGCTALFAGSSGTGKTMAAEVIANELGLDLYCIDLASVVSKYIGETEKNLDRIFRAAEHANGILFFDEADALFGKRSEVRDSHDRYANIEVSYLLQKMEQFEGLAILASNLRHHLDEALVRRLAFTILFPFPDTGLRRRIWQGVWPATLPLAADLDLDFLAAQFKTSGGLIKNIALASAFLAAADGGVVTMDHLRHATKREYQKLGKILSSSEIAGSSGA